LKKIILITALAVLGQGVFAQGTLYTFIVNIAGEGFPLPLIGVANFAHGDHSIAEVGVLNINTGSFGGLKAGVFNFTSGDVRGVSTGAANINLGDMLGLNAGAFNLSGSGQGIQASAVNININGFFGVQAGALNFSGGETYGMQVGAINYAGTMTGVQIGAVNIVADGERALPIGLIPIVLRNGYYAVEVNAQDICPVNVSIKMGVEKLYTTLSVSYNFFTNAFYAGGGLGTLIVVNDRFFLNLEVVSRSIINRSGYFLTSAEPAVGFNILPHLSIIAGPRIEYEYLEDKTTDDRFVRLIDFKIDTSSSIVIGAKAALRFRF
jgi:hypothetical protein